MAKLNLFGLGFLGTTIVVLFAALLVLPYIKRSFPGLLEGYATYDCSRDVTCPEGSFCQSNTCIPINAPKGSVPSSGYYS
jgi:hypothetical protein